MISYEEIKKNKQLKEFAYPFVLKCPVCKSEFTRTCWTKKGYSEGCCVNPECAYCGDARTFFE